MEHSYYIDFEFLEGKQDKTFLGFKYGETKHLIDMISIGIVSDDGREYYAICKEFNLKEAWNRHQVVKKKRFQTDYSEYEEKEYWLRDNVLKPIYDELFDKYCYTTNSMTGDEFVYFNYENMKYLLSRYGKSSKQIAEEVEEFCSPLSIFNIIEYKKQVSKEAFYKAKIAQHEAGIVFYGYYSAYDWVCLCQLYGKMINLPDGFPWYCKDLQQELDSYISKTWEDVKDSTWQYQKAILSKLKNHKDYPVKVGAHNALADARWNKQLHEFLKNIACGK